MSLWHKRAGVSNVNLRLQVDQKSALADLRVMGSEDPAREGSVSSFALRILITWMRKKMLRVITTITGTARNKVDELKMSLSCLFA